VAQIRDDEPRGPEGAPRALLAGAAVALFTRPMLWLLSYGVLGPALGPTLALAGITDARMVAVVEGVVLVIAVCVALVAARLVRGGQPNAVHLGAYLGWLFAADTALYVLGVLVLTVLYLARDGVLAGLIIFTVLPLATNAYLLVQARKVIRSCQAELRAETAEPAGAAQ
jgi:hypothetical protein